jgi:DNA repair protein SbcD/Mre11
LLAHGEARDLPHQARSISQESLEAGWEYVALGHYHVCQQVALRAWYAGSLDYTSTDPWKDLREQAAAGLPGKGFLTVELPGGVPEFHPIAAPRLLVDLESLSGERQSPAELSALINERLETVPDGAVARLVVHDVPRLVGRDLDHAMIRSHKGRLLQLHLDIRRPQEEAAKAHRFQVYRNLDQMVRDFLTTWPLPPDLDRQEFIALGADYFAKTAEKTGRPEQEVAA